MNGRISFKKFKFITILFCLAGLFPLNGATGILLPSGLCVQCHMMRPEYYTWQQSSHSAVSCVACHVPPDPKGAAGSYAEALKNLYQLVTGKFAAPVKLLRPAPDDTCERCHNMADKANDRAGDMKVNHKLHRDRQVRCFKCHRGIAHGHIADRGVTLAADYARWEPALARSMMKDKQFTAPDMDMCFTCHQLRQAPVTCNACHIKSVIPANHRAPSFKQGSHGKLALRNIRECDKCHKYMSSQKPEGLREDVKYLEFLNGGQQAKGDSAVLYSRTNTQCRDCHRIRPPGHRGDFRANHGLAAARDRARCLTCHDNRYLKISGKSSVTAGQGVTDVACGNCHPSIHRENVQFLAGYHPVPLPANPRVTKSCFECHPEKLCTKCHSI